MSWAILLLLMLSRMDKQHLVPFEDQVAIYQSIPVDCSIADNSSEELAHCPAVI